MTKNILFLCTGNSARSIMAEAYMNHAAKGAWRAWSAGSHPTGAVNPLAIETLRAHDVPAGGADAPLSSKSWDAFADDDAPLMDVVATVCDNAAGEVCPVWPRRDGVAPRILHWGFPDPAAASGTHAEKRAAFEAVFADVRGAIDAFLNEDGGRAR